MKPNGTLQHDETLPGGGEYDFSQIVEGLPGFIAIAGADGKQEYANRRLLDYVGKELAEMAGDGWIDIIHPEEQDAVRDEWVRCTSAGQAIDINHRLRRFDGTYRWFHARVEPLYDDQERIIRWYGLITDIDDRMKAEEALRASEQQLRQMVDAIPGLLVVASPDGEVEYINEPVQKITGRSLESLKDLGWASMIHPEDAQYLMDTWLSAVRTGTAMEPEYRQLCADGTYRWWQNRMEPFRDGDGVILRWYGVITDIDGRKRAEQALQENEQLLIQMVNAIPAMLFVMSPDGEVEYANQPLIDFLGRGFESLRNLGWTSSIHPDDAGALVDRWRAMVATGLELNTEFRVRRVDGVYRWFQSRVQPFRDIAGEIIRWYGALTDIDDRKKAEEALGESEHQLRLTVETISALVWRATPNGWLDYVNQRGLDYTGKSLKDFAISGWLDLVHPDDADETIRRWQHSVETGEPYIVTYRFRRADGLYRWFQVRAEPLLDGEGRVIHWYGLHIDVDEGRRMEEELRSSQARLSSARQIATVAELSASIAHEINQPLGAVVTNGHACQSWLSAEPPNVERALPILDRIIRDGNAAAEVVRKIRALFKRTAPAKVLLNIGEVIAEVHHLMLDEIKRKKIVVELDLEENLPPALADRVQMQQVVVNLMHNGIDAMDSVHDRPRLLKVCARRDGANLVVEVSDQGGGLQDAEKVFEPFFTTKESGMGVGLAISRSIIEAHDGSLRAENNTHWGAVFTFTLPIHTGDTA